MDGKILLNVITNHEQIPDFKQLKVMKQVYYPHAAVP